MDNTKNIIVVGSTGFIGVALLPKLKDCFREYKVTGISSSECNLLVQSEVELLSRHWNPETVLIFCSSIKRQRGDNLDLFRKNIEMVVNLSEQIKHKPVKKLIFFSSAAVYGEDIENNSISEDTLVTPTSYYGISKFTSEKLLQKALSETETALVILRPPTIYGPKEKEYSYGPTGFLRKALEKKEIVFWGDGSELREFVFIDDIIHIVKKLITSDFTGVLNTVSGVSYSFKQILENIEILTSNAIKINYKERTKDKVNNGFAPNLIKKILGEYSFHTLESGLKKTYSLEKDGH